MQAQGRLPEARHPNSFSRWNKVEGEWIEDSDNNEPAPTGSTEGSNWDVPELMPKLGHDNDDEAVFEPACNDDLWQPLMLSLLDMPILSDALSEPSVSLPTDAFMGSIDMAHAYMHYELDEEQSYMDELAQAVALQPDANTAREHTHNSITDFVEGVFNAIHKALLWAAETLVETVDVVADMVGYMQGAGTNNKGTKGWADMLQDEAVPVAIDAPTARPMTCNCGLPVKIWVVAKQSSNYGRTFVCCPKRHNGPDGSEQCQYFRFADELPMEAATNYPSFRRKQQQRELMFNCKLPDGHTNVSSANQEPEVSDDGGMHFRTAKGGKMEFVQHSTGKVLVTICIANKG